MRINIFFIFNFFLVRYCRRRQTTPTCAHTHSQRTKSVVVLGNKCNFATLPVLCARYDFSLASSAAAAATADVVVAHTLIQQLWPSIDSICMIYINNYYYNISIEHHHCFLHIVVMVVLEMVRIRIWKYIPINNIPLFTRQSHIYMSTWFSDFLSVLILNFPSQSMGSNIIRSHTGDAIFKKHIVNLKIPNYTEK